MLVPNLYSANRRNEIYVLSTSNAYNVIWLEHVKKLFVVAPSAPISIDTTLFNEKQRIAYNIVYQHFHANVKQTLALWITGQGGSGKSFVIN